MSVLKSKDNTELFISCDCGCEQGVHIRIDKENDNMYFLMTYANGNWYTDQDKTICAVVREKLKKIWCIIRNKDFHYSDITMTQKDFQEFKEYINNVDYDIR
jgi:hypothetical protein